MFFTEGQSAAAERLLTAEANRFILTVAPDLALLNPSSVLDYFLQVEERQVWLDVLAERCGSTVIYDLLCWAF